MNIGEVLDRLRPDFPDITIPKIRFLEDKGLIKPERTAAGLPQVLRRRRRPAALRPADAARPLPAAQGDRRAPRRDRPRPRAAADRAGRARPCRRWRSPPTACRARSRSARDDNVRLSRRELLKIAEIAEELLDQLEQFGLVDARGRHRPLRHRRPGDRPDRRASWPTSASSRATCAPSRPPPTARSAWSSRSSPRTSAAATRPPRPAPRRPSARSPRCRCGCTRPWSRPVCGRS